MESYVTDQAKRGNAVTRAQTGTRVREKIERHADVLVPIVLRVSPWHAVRDNGVSSTCHRRVISVLPVRVITTTTQF